MAICRYSSLSVDTKVREMYFDFTPLAMAHAIRGFPQKSLIFLPFTPLEPARAGTMAYILERSMATFFTMNSLRDRLVGGSSADMLMPHRRQETTATENP